MIPMPSSERPLGNGWDARGVATLITSIAALVAALAAGLKPESSARKVYDAQVQSNAKLTQDLQTQHEEIEQLRAYLHEEHDDPVPVPLVMPAATLTHDAGMVVQVPLRPFVRPPPVAAAHPKMGVASVPYKAVTGTADIGPTL